MLRSTMCYITFPFFPCWFWLYSCILVFFVCNFEDFAVRYLLNVFGVCNLLLFLLLCDLLIALVLYDLLVALLHFLFLIFLSCGQPCDLILCCVYKDGVMHGFIV